MFGGGVEPRTSDPTFPIRPTAIRGQLEFWWRATVGAQYTALAELRAAQSDIWGSIQRASRVDVLVDPIKWDNPMACARYEMNLRQPEKYRSMPSWNPPFRDTSLPYVLFPFQGQLRRGYTAVEVEPAACIPQASFRLVIRCPKELWPQVEPALWAWVNFGGLGSRTRRGCGAIFCREVAPRDCDDLFQLCKPFVQNAPAPRDWPTLAAAILVGGKQPNAIAAWDHVIERFRQFRQGVGLGRNQGQQQNRPGRSRFPEPETIRRVTGQRFRRHARLSHIPDNAFPRAEFGLPIVFHFKDHRDGDPANTVLYPSHGPDGKPRERMASPLILKPLALANQKAVPLILRLKTPDLAGVDLRQKEQDREPSLPLPRPTHIRGAALARYKDSPLARSPNGSALEAFLEYALTEGFRKVNR
jgi:CRISPR-associated protein Cmr1